jgi:two-component system cell cycle response regulator
MTARVLIVDDILPNVKLLEAKLSGEYFDVITALSGAEGIQKAETLSPDIILLDVMMPGMDGFECCQLLKSNPLTSHIPIVMVTALTDATDRVRGLEAGADDFLSKPVNDVALMARVRSLVRLKMTVDEWRVRENTATQFGLIGKQATILNESYERAKVLVIEDKAFESEKFVETLKHDEDIVMPVRSGEQGIALAQQNNFDIITVSLNLATEDGLRLCSHLRSNERTRSIPILIIGEETDMKRIAVGLEIGAYDYILRPIDRNELLARVRTQVRRKRYQDRLKANYEVSLSLALTDTLTGLYNRRYLMVHLEKLLKKNADAKKSLCVLMIDIDHFKQINDTHGHSVGDETLKIFSERVLQRLRSFDLVARIGGEEFIVVLPDINMDMAIQVAERLRKGICSEPFKVGTPSAPLDIDVSISVGAMLINMGQGDITIEQVLKRVDEEVYKAKNSGRNCVYFAGLGQIGVNTPVVADTLEDTIKKIL